MVKIGFVLYYFSYFVVAVLINFSENFVQLFFPIPPLCDATEDARRRLGSGCLDLASL